MGEAEPKDERAKKDRRFSQEQYDMLKRCSDKKDMTEWNEWRKEHPDEDIWLVGGDFSRWYLKGINFTQGGATVKSQTEKPTARNNEVHLEEARFESAILEGAEFLRAHLEGTCFWHAVAKGAYFCDAHLENAELGVAHLEGSDFSGSNLRGADFTCSHVNGANLAQSDLRECTAIAAVVDGETDLAYCKVNRYRRQGKFTDFALVALDVAIIDPATKQLLECNIRRKNWEESYKQHKILKWPVWLFWLMSDYGLSTWRIVAVFVGFAVVFSSIYYVWGLIAPPGIVDYLFVDGNGERVAWWIVPWRAIHFSVVIMTVGFTNMHANAHSLWAHIFVSLQMILGFVLLGALVTRFAVLFTAGGPAGKFADEKTIWQRLKERWNKIKKKR